MVKQEKHTLDILGSLRRDKENLKTSNKSATFFVAIGYLVGFVLMTYLRRMDILAYVSVFVFMLFAIVLKDFIQAKRDIEAIDELYLEYAMKNKNKK